MLLPIAKKPEPMVIKESGPIYNNKADYAEEIRSFGEEIAASASGEYPSEKLKMVTTLSMDELYGMLPMDALREIPQATRPLPFGVDAATYQPVFSDPGISAPMNHIIISGASGTGRTSTLRTIMRAAADMHGPKGARFFILDASGALVKDFQNYRDQGFLKPSSYICLLYTSPSPRD